MHPFYEDYLDKIVSLHKEIASVLSGLPQEALDWSPGEESNSLAVLAVHVAGAYRYWFSDVIAGIPSGRDRPAEFRTIDLPASTILQKLDESLELVRSVLQQLSLEDLSGSRISPRDGQTYRISWSLLHVLEHTALHLGHMQVTRHRWEALHRP